jgi:hypothetical protein
MEQLTPRKNLLLIRQLIPSVIVSSILDPNVDFPNSIRPIIQDPLIKRCYADNEMIRISGGRDERDPDRFNRKPLDDDDRVGKHKINFC